MFEKLTKQLTKDYKSVPLFYVELNLVKYLNEGKKGSCVLQLHPSLRDDEYIIEQLNNLVDHIRENHDMEELVK